MTALAASVIVPAYNQCQPLGITLAGFARQKGTSQRWELIVVDDGSSDGTAGLSQAWQTRLPLVWLRRPHQGRAAARNAGLAAARGRIVIFCDADRAPGNTFLERHLARHAEAAEGVRAVVGGIWEVYFSDLGSQLGMLASDADSDFLRLRTLARVPPYARTVLLMFDAAGKTRYAMPWIAFFSGNVSLPAEACRQAGAFQESFTGWGFEHFELGYRLKAAGVEFLHEPDACNYHFAHRREPNAYTDGIRDGLAQFLRIHPEEPVRLLGEFLRGELSLEQYHNRIAGSAAPMQERPGCYYRQLRGPRPPPSPAH